jgi:hypothetical protein
MKSPSECGWKLGDTEALRDERQLGRHAGYALRVDLLTTKAFSWKLPGGCGHFSPTLRQAGRRFKTLSRRRPPGQHERVVWRSRTDRGNQHANSEHAIPLCEVSLEPSRVAE